jgi:ABC-type phosphate transport system substrate-binding protein
VSVRGVIAKSTPARRTFVALSAAKRRGSAMPRWNQLSGALRRWFAGVGCTAVLVLTSSAVFAGALDMALPVYQPEREVSGEISSVGDDAMEPLMAAWLVAFQKKQPAIRKGARWEHLSGATAFDMMKSPLLVEVASAANQPIYLAVNKRPGAPLPPKVAEFVSFVLSRDGQEIVAKQGRFDSLTMRQAAEERLKLQGFLAPLDPALPPYAPAAPVNGVISSVGSDGMKTLMDRWMREFRRVQPGVRKGERWEHLGTLNGFYALIAGETDLAPMGREIWPDERAAYEATRHQNAPLEIRVARGGFDTPQRTTAQAIFVNASNPLAQITLPQLAAILGRPQTITRWGQLGLTGQWTARPVTIYTPPLVAPNAMSMQIMVLKGGAWSGAVREGSIADTALAIARDPGAIGFGGFEEGGAGLKTLSVSVGDRGPFYEGNAENASSGRYPLTRYMYIRLNRKPGESLPPQVREFLRYILSREGQEPILYSAYFPLTASEAKEELVKLK